jgi:ubiquinone/menaquinone biosynthesis C-methylase UbiE
MDAVALPKPEDVGVFYDRFTRLFEILWGDSLHFGYWPPGAAGGGSIEEGQERLTDLMASKVTVGMSDSFLDVGCGTGRASLRLAQAKGCSLTGINVSQQQVEAANQRAARAGLSERVRFRIADAMAMPFSGDAFEGAWAFESLLHMPSLSRAVREIHRVIKPAGRLVISDVVVIRPMSADDEAYYRSTYPVAPMLKQGDYAATLQSAGFTVLEVLDLSDRVAQTLALTLDNIDRCSAQINEAYGPDFIGVLKSAWSQSIKIHLQSLGYAVFVAQKG